MNLQEQIRRILREEVNKFSKESTMSDLITMMGTSRIREGNRIEIVDDRLIKYESTFGINIDYLDRKTLHVINSFMNERGWFPTNIKLENERESKRYSKNVKHYLGKKNVVINYESTSNSEINLNTKTAYHVTTDRYLNSILTNGLTPRTESKLSDHPERIYLFQDKESQNSMARALFNSLSDDQKKMIKKYVVLEIDLTKIPNHKFYADPQASISYGAIFTTQSIPKFAIRKINEIDTSNLTPYTESEPVELEFAQTSPEMIKRYGEIDDKLKKIGDDKLNMSWDDLMNLKESIKRTLMGNI